MEFCWIPISLKTTWIKWLELSLKVYAWHGSSPFLGQGAEGLVKLFSGKNKQLDQTSLPKDANVSSNCILWSFWWKSKQTFHEGTREERIYFHH